MRTRSKAPLLQAKKALHRSTRDDDSEAQSVSSGEYVYLKEREGGKWSEQRLTVSYIPARLVGRREEAQQIYTFLQSCIMNKINRKVLYISGVPGCGKTASTIQILNQFVKEVKGVKVLYVNTLTLKKPQDIYRLLYSFFRPSCKREREKGSKSSDVERLLPMLKRPHIVVIDEFDFLITRDEMILYNLFEWCSQATNFLSYIAISNTFDLPLKFSAKVNSRMGDNKLSFKPYTQEEVKEVIADRLANCPYFSNSAIVYASKKLSQYSSDIRIILNILQEAFREHMEERRPGQIEVKHIARIWEQKMCKQAKDPSAEPTLHEMIKEYAAKQGEQCTTRSLFEFLEQKRRVTHGNMLVLLRQLEEMGQIKLRASNNRGFPCQLMRLKSKE